MADNDSYIYLFGKNATLHRINMEGNRFLTPLNLQHIVPHHFLRLSSYISGLNNVRRFCNAMDDGNYHVLCPLYKAGDFQGLVTGKTIRGLDPNPERAAHREVEEETHIHFRQPFQRYESSFLANVDEDGILLPTDSDVRVYGRFANYTELQFKQYEVTNRSYSQKISTIVYGSIDSFTEIFEVQDTSYKLKFAEADIVGFLLIPTATLLMIINHNN